MGGRECLSVGFLHARRRRIFCLKFYFPTVVACDFFSWQAYSHRRTRAMLGMRACVRCVCQDTRDAHAHMHTLESLLRERFGDLKSDFSLVQVAGWILGRSGAALGSGHHQEVAVVWLLHATMPRYIDSYRRAPRGKWWVPTRGDTVRTHSLTSSRNPLPFGNPELKKLSKLSGCRKLVDFILVLPEFAW